MIETTIARKPLIPGFGLFTTFYFALLLASFLLALFAKSSNLRIGQFYQVLSYALMAVNVVKLSGLFFALHRSFRGSSSGDEDDLVIMGAMSLYFLLFNCLILCLIKPK